MKRTHILPAVLISLGFINPAIAADTVSAETQSKTKVEKDAEGNYHKKQTTSVESKDSAGTKTSTETKVDIEADADGTAEKKVTTESSTDPKGLLNKRKTSTTDTVKYEDGKVEKKYKKKVDGKTVEENVETSPAR